MTQTITRAYDSYQHAADAVKGLKDRGFSDDQISLIARTNEETTATASGEGAGIGAGIGGALGAGAGLLAGLGIMAIPGVGPVVAAGWLAATAAGAAAGAVGGGAVGGIVGSQVAEGVPVEHAHVYAEGVRRGGSLVTVRSSDDMAAEATRILDSFGPIDPVTRGAEYRAQGWERFDEEDVNPLGPSSETISRASAINSPVDRLNPLSTSPEAISRASRADTPVGE